MRHALAVDQFGLSHPARIVIVRMAAHCMDETGLYSKGHPVLAIGLGYPDPESPRAVRAVTRAVSELVAKGIVEIVAEAAPGRTRVYRIKGL